MSVKDFGKSSIRINDLFGHADHVVLDCTRLFHANMSLLNGNALVTGAGKRTETRVLHYCNESRSRNMQDQALGGSYRLPTLEQASKELLWQI